MWLYQGHFIRFGSPLAMSLGRLRPSPEVTEVLLSSTLLTLSWAALPQFFTASVQGFPRPAWVPRPRLVQAVLARVGVKH